LPKVEVNKKYSFTGHRDSVYALQPGGSDCFYSAGGDGFIVRWNLNDPTEGELIARLPNAVYALLYLPDKNQLIAAQNTSGIHLLDPSSKKEIANLQLTTSSIFDLKSFGGQVLVGTGEGELIVVDVQEWRIKNRIKVSSKSVRTVAINSLTKEIAVGSSDYKIRIYTSEDLHLTREIEAHNNSIFALSFTPDQQFLLSGARDAHLKVWDSKNNYRLAKDVAAHLFAINHIYFSPDGNYFATSSMDKSIKLWRTEDFQLLKVIDKSRHAGHGTSVNKLLWMTGSAILLSASGDRSISGWDLLFL
jgi:WD40 repeat protein